MLINRETYFGLNKEEIDHLGRKMPPIWENDPNIDEKLLDVAKILLGLTVKISDGPVSIVDLFDTTFEGSRIDIPKFVFTKSSLEICEKISISGRSLSLVQEVSAEVLEASGKPFDVYGHLSIPNEFYRYMIVANTIFVIRLFLYPSTYEEYLKGVPLKMFQTLTPKELKEDYEKSKPKSVGYSVFRIGLGRTPEEYEQAIHPEWVKFMQLFMFLRYAETETVYVAAGKKIGSKKSGYTNATKSDIVVVNSNWNKVVVRTEGFSVEGHLRLQSHGPNHSLRKFIWIKPYEKSGYTRKGGGTKEIFDEARERFSETLNNLE